MTRNVKIAGKSLDENGAEMRLPTLGGRVRSDTVRVGRLMQIFSILFSIVCLFLSACSRNPTPVASLPPQFVKASDVKSIVVAESKLQADECARLAERGGAKVIYQNEAGVLMLDKRAGELALGACGATVTDNRELPLEPFKADEQKVDLSTLLRLIPAEEIGARTFVKDHPTFDGRGTIIAVLDTGVELDVPP